MYKIIIQTKDIVAHTKSPLHQTIYQHQSKQQQISPTLNAKHHLIQQIKGKIHLLRNLNTTTKEIMSKLKSRAVFVANFNKAIQKFLCQRLEEIQNIDKIEEHIKIDSQTIIGIKRHITVVFKSVAMAEQFNAYVNEENIKGTLVVYIQSVTIVCTEGNISQQNWKKISIDEQTGKESWVQLPNCQKCLQILEPEVTGIYIKPKVQQQATNLNICKVCLIRSKQQTVCSECSQIQDNWICMICGTIGCGRYKNADAFKHYTSSKHFLSLDLKSNRIWNYKLDCFSHRVHGRDDGHMEEHQIQQNYEVDDHDIETQFWKYCNVVSEQLDKQRNFYNKIKDEQIERYNAEQKMLQDRIKELTAIRQQKKENLKKKVKKNKKVCKRFSQLEEQIEQQKSINKHFQQSVKSNIQKPKKESEIIKKKKEQLKILQEEIEKMLMSLSQA